MLPRTANPGAAIRRVLLTMICLGTILANGGVAIAASTPESPTNVAGIVVDYGDGRRSYALVPFSEPSISGIDLLRRSGLSLLAVSFGGLGEGVCAIETTGCDLDACRRRLCQTADRTSPFWQYVRADADGGWAPVALGASATQVTDGQIDGWAWTGTTPALPALTFAELTDLVDADQPGEAMTRTISPDGAEASGAGETSRVIVLIAGAVAVLMVGAGGWSIWTVRRLRAADRESGR